MQAPSVLHYVVLPTRVGRVLVLMSRKGVVDIVLDARDPIPSDLLRVLRSRFPNTRLLPDDGSRGSWAAAVAARIDGARPDFVAPIDLAWSAPAARAVARASAEFQRAS